jgi:hypothetical protein
VEEDLWVVEAVVVASVVKEEVEAWCREEASCDVATPLADT